MIFQSLIISLLILIYTFLLVFHQPLCWFHSDETCSLSLPPFICCVILFPLSHPVLINGCEYCHRHFMLHFNILSRQYLPLFSRPACTSCSNLWLSDVLLKHLFKFKAANRKWYKSKGQVFSFTQSRTQTNHIHR